MANAPTKPHVWFELAIAFGREHKTFTAFNYDSPQYFAWKVYFSTIEFYPSTFRSLLPGGSWTAPCEWPDQLDIVLPAGYPRTHHEIRQAFEKPQPTYSDRQRRENLTQLRERFGKNWGLGRGTPRNERLLAEWRLKQQASFVAPTVAREAAE